MLVLNNFGQWKLPCLVDTKVWDWKVTQTQPMGSQASLLLVLVPSPQKWKVFITKGFHCKIFAKYASSMHHMIHLLWQLDRKWERSQMYHIEDHKVGECYYKVRIVRKMSLHRKKTQLFFFFAKKDFNSVTQAIYHICLEIAIPVLHYA